VFVRHGLADCVMETEKMIRCFAALPKAGLRDMKCIVVVYSLGKRLDLDVCRLASHGTAHYATVVF